ncbi:7724_t:CDS:2 [Ambispora leptoticha]|uniref:7724_t:CDS:1 n=1 Tax=Ambispora leptoticha TaxID=144679 RepID=A0A9N9E5B9_9GLOM|nr:7724_t:CDS:2 [Ambispora leptoticha]
MFNNVRYEDEEQNSSYRSYAHNVPIQFFGPSGTPAPDPSNKSKLTTRSWNSNAPKWRTAAGGLSLEAYCYNSSCQAYNKGYVLVKWGYRDFDFFLNDRDVGCPMCGRYVQTKNFGFCSTWYKVVGCKRDKPDEPLQHVDTEWDFVSNDRYYTFLDSPEDLVYWGQLKIKVSKSRPY